MVQLVKNLPAMQETWVEKIPWRREWLPTPVFWPGEFHGLYSPGGLKELDTTMQLSLSYTHIHVIFKAVSGAVILQNLYTGEIY